MTAGITRKDFCGSLLGATVLLLIQSCGGGSDYGSPPAQTGCSDTIADNHGHVLSVARADLDAATDKSYSIEGSAGHDHMVTLTVVQLQTLKTGTSVRTTSSTTLAHQHDISVTCM